MSLKTITAEAVLSLDGRPAYAVEGVGTIETILGYFDGQDLSLLSLDGYSLADTGNVLPASPLVPIGEAVVLRMSDDIFIEVGRHLVDAIESKVPKTRLINTNAPLTGGGDLTADLTLGVSAATTAALGVVELATDGEDAANVVVQGNDSRLDDARHPIIEGLNGAVVEFVSQTEEIVLSTIGTVTDSVADLLAGPGVILAVSARWTVALAGAGVANFGDSVVEGRFGSLAAGTGVLIEHWQGNVSTRAKGPVQAAPAKLRITTDVIPSAGAVRVHVVSIRSTPPTS